MQKFNHGHSHAHQHKLGHGRGNPSKHFESVLANTAQSDICRIVLSSAKLLLGRRDQLEGGDNSFIEENLTQMDSEGEIFSPESTMESSLLDMIKKQFPKETIEAHPRAIFGLVASANTRPDDSDDDTILDKNYIDQVLDPNAKPCSGYMFLYHSIKEIAQRIEYEESELLALQKQWIEQLSPPGMLCRDMYQYRGLVARRFFSQQQIKTQEQNSLHPRERALITLREEFEVELGDYFSEVFHCLNLLTCEQEILRDHHTGKRSFRGGILSARSVMNRFGVTMDVAKNTLKLLHRIYGDTIKVTNETKKPSKACVCLFWDEHLKQYQYCSNDEDKFMNALLADRKFGEWREHMSRYLELCVGWKADDFLEEMDEQGITTYEEWCEWKLKKLEQQFGISSPRSKQWAAYYSENDWLTKKMKIKLVNTKKLEKVIGSEKIEPWIYLSKEQMAYWFMLRLLDEYEKRKKYYIRIALLIANTQQVFIRSDGREGKKKLTCTAITEQLMNKKKNRKDASEEEQRTFALLERKVQRWVKSMVIDVGDGRMMYAKDLMARNDKDILMHYICEIYAYPERQQMLNKYCSNPKRGLTKTAVWEILLNCYGVTIARRTVSNYCDEVLAEGMEQR